MATEQTTSSPDQSKRAEELKQNLTEHIDAARGKLDALKADVARMREEDMEGLQARRDEIKQRLDEQNTKAKQLHSDIASWAKQKMAQAKEGAESFRQRQT
jgi:regulator of replication initiation timing